MICMAPSLVIRYSKTGNDARAQVPRVPPAARQAQAPAMIHALTAMPEFRQENRGPAWSRNGLKLLAKTPTGRVTIRALRMNRRGVTVLRSMLIELGLHPAE